MIEGAPDGSAEGDDADTVHPDRLDREHQELFHELRAVIPGAQVLFAFLLTVAFTPTFEDLNDTDRTVYFVTFILSGVALCLLLAPAAYHRIQFRQRDKDAMLRLANIEAFVAMVVLSISLSGVVYLIGALVYSELAGLIAGAALFTLTIVIWWMVPLVRRRRLTSRP